MNTNGNLTRPSSVGTLANPTSPPAGGGERTVNKLRLSNSLTIDALQKMEHLGTSLLLKMVKLLLCWILQSACMMPYLEWRRLRSRAVQLQQLLKEWNGNGGVIFLVS